MNASWNPMHAIIGLFEIHDNIRFAMIKQLQFLL
jgi:hypothetical protein